MIFFLLLTLGISRNKKAEDRLIFLTQLIYCSVSGFVLSLEMVLFSSILLLIGIQVSKLFTKILKHRSNLKIFSVKASINPLLFCYSCFIAYMICQYVSPQNPSQLFILTQCMLFSYLFIICITNSSTIDWNLISLCLKFIDVKLARYNCFYNISIIKKLSCSA